MSTSGARTRANRTWRERTGLKPIQAYLHAGTVEQLDKLVKERGATGRTAVLTQLIELAACSAPQSALAPEPIERQPDTRRCECRTASGGRCCNKAAVVIKAVSNDQLGEYGSCKRHIRFFQPYNLKRSRACLHDTGFQLRGRREIGAISKVLDVSKGGSNPQATLPSGGTSRTQTLKAADLPRSVAALVKLPHR